MNSLPQEGGYDTRATLSPKHSLPRMGKVASGASRIGQWRYEKDRGRSSQVRRLREHPIHCYAIPLSQWGSQRGGGFAAPKGSQPRLAALGSPFQGKRLAWTLPPSYGRRCPEGAEVRWGKRYEREREDRLMQTIYESTRAPLCGPPSPMGKSKRRGLRRPKRKPTPPCCARQPLPREGARVDTPSFLWKEVPRRGGGWLGKAV